LQTHLVSERLREFFVEQWNFLEEKISRSKARLFEEVTASMLGSCDSYKTQLLHGTDYWRTVLDAASGIGVYGNNGVAAGDFDNDGFDDLYICQPSGLPNRLYRNRGDGTSRMQPKNPALLSSTQLLAPSLRISRIADFKICSSFAILDLCCF